MNGAYNYIYIYALILLSNITVWLSMVSSVCEAKIQSKQPYGKKFGLVKTKLL